MAKTYMETTKFDIVAHAKANGNIQWLKDFKNSIVQHEVYPRKTKEITDKNGKPRKTSVLDKSQAPQIVMEHPTAQEVKSAYIKKFMPELLSSTPKEKTLLDLIDEL